MSSKNQNKPEPVTVKGWRYDTTDAKDARIEFTAGGTTSRCVNLKITQDGVLRELKFSILDHWRGNDKMALARMFTWLADQEEKTLDESEASS